jgi:hypothetical protein
LCQGGPGRIFHHFYSTTGRGLENGIARIAQARGATPIAAVERIINTFSDEVNTNLLDKLHPSVQERTDDECEALRLLRENCSDLVSWTIP